MSNTQGEQKSISIEQKPIVIGKKSKSISRSPVKEVVKGLVGSISIGTIVGSALFGTIGVVTGVAIATAIFGRNLHSESQNEEDENFEDLV